ncbi:adenylate/guanylate cyclase domain-containing protein [Aquabacterium sp. OR-4]|uniref:adenylate/guanylate cyclase domain-containing protein n=1 Tax=Aquabacterium sp. OR-4 TaxID=2978127 RepID=UPI0028C6C3E9|nr:adenylate/guanylate cyclase domain-containing protein [Aquabacterium sp. OR-4]MDT7835412.1 adenylate/guanylate cyclase domain-containing protein [Aquabacterium sp. OR-4]
MTRIAERTVLFADLRGSTALYETLGNAEATSVVTHTVAALTRSVPAAGGVVVKTLGDGLMAVFETPAAGLQSALLMHDELDQLVSRGRERGASAGLRGLKLQVALARGEIVEMGGDCFGDAVNVAARLLDHASDNETLITAEVLAGLSGEQKKRFRSLDWMHLRGRAEPVQVHVAGGRRGLDMPVTQFGPVPSSAEPEAVRLSWGPLEVVFDGGSMPIVLGRSPQAQFRVDDSRVSRSHARIDWHGGAFQVTDLSYNGSYVQFASSDDVVSLRRGRCMLHGSGTIGLGGTPKDPNAPCVRFEVLAFYDTVPQPG